MYVEKFVLGSYMTNSYLVYDNEGGYIIDPASTDIINVLTEIKERNILLKGVILTHGHSDHIFGLQEILKEYKDITVYIGVEDEEFLYEPRLNLSNHVLGMEIKYDSSKIKIIKIKEGDTIGNITILDTPGHTPGSKSLLIKEDKILFSGDTLFANGVGRVDLPGGDSNKLNESLRKLSNLDENIIVYCGHGEETSIGQEKINF